VGASNEERRRVWQYHCKYCQAE